MKIQARGIALDFTEDGRISNLDLEDLGLNHVADELEAGSPYPDWSGPTLWPLKNYPRGSHRASVL